MKILFIRKYKKPSGGHIKVRDYLEHCLAHTAIEPYVYFTPDSTWEQSGFWECLRSDRIVGEPWETNWDLLFLGGRDWEQLPAGWHAPPIMNLIQHVKHANPKDKRFPFLKHKALRICVSDEVAQAIRPHANGEIRVIANGIPSDMFDAGQSKMEPGSVLIWAKKDPALGELLAAELKAGGRPVRVLKNYVDRESFAAALKSADIFVGLPHRTEGFYLPALEAMASGCAVVCADAVGNRGFCEDGKTCLMPAFGDLESHVRAVKSLSVDAGTKERIRSAGRKIAELYSVDRERTAFHKLLDELPIGSPA